MPTAAGCISGVLKNALLRRCRLRRSQTERPIVWRGASLGRVPRRCELKRPRMDFLLDAKCSGGLKINNVEAV